MKEYYNLHADLFKKVAQRQEVWNKFMELERRAKDPSRLVLVVADPFITGTGSVVDAKLFFLGIRFPFSSEFWIRILLDLQKVSDPVLDPTLNQCCGSESEIIRMFWLDPKKKFGFGFRYCSRMNIFAENQKIKHLKEKNLMFFYLNFFVSAVQVSEHI
jgi:hypothetical protein